MAVHAERSAPRCAPPKVATSDESKVTCKWCLRALVQDRRHQRWWSEARGHSLLIREHVGNDFEQGARALLELRRRHEDEYAELLLGERTLAALGGAS